MRVIQDLSPLQGNSKKTAERAVVAARNAVLDLAVGIGDPVVFDNDVEAAARLIGSQWKNLELEMATDKALTDAIAKIPSNVLVRILNEATLCRSQCSDQSSLPGTLDASSVPSSSEEDEEEQDSFDSSSLPLPRIDSSTIPLVMEVTSRSGGFGSKDPLFNGVCLYSGSMSEDQVKTYGEKHGVKTADVYRLPCEKKTLESSWFLPSVLRHLLQMQR
mmetsp:Transcript_60553/g.91346  ORF Transcript_60553/g.91346 Transcript_60553/m.91346 type:complete len:218 (-) Transcript_60553:163-816(-)